MIKKLIGMLCCAMMLAGTMVFAQEPASVDIPIAGSDDAGFAGLVSMDRAGLDEGLKDFRYQDPQVFMRVMLPVSKGSFDLAKLRTYSLAGKCEGNAVTLRAKLDLDSPESAAALQKTIEDAAADARSSSKASLKQWGDSVKVQTAGASAVVDMTVSREFIKKAGKAPMRVSFWLVIGLVGQALFAGRFIVQWIVSEKQKKSVIPIYFWFFSIGGGIVLLAYAISIMDPVFILGQSTGLFIYIRNLMLLSKEKKTAAEPA